MGIPATHFWWFRSVFPGSLAACFLDLPAACFWVPRNIFQGLVQRFLESPQCVSGLSASKFRARDFSGNNIRLSVCLQPFFSTARDRLPTGSCFGSLERIWKRRRLQDSGERTYPLEVLKLSGNYVQKEGRGSGW